MICENQFESTTDIMYLLLYNLDVKKLNFWKITIFVDCSLDVI